MERTLWNVLKVFTMAAAKPPAKMPPIQSPLDPMTLGPAQIYVLERLRNGCSRKLQRIYKRSLSTLAFQRATTLTLKRTSRAQFLGVLGEGGEPLRSRASL